MLFRSLIFDSSFTVISNELVLSGTHHRPHGLIVGDRFYLGYDTEGSNPTFAASLSLYSITRE